MLQWKDTENLGLVPFIPRYCFIAAPAQSRLIPLSQIITRSPGQQRLSSSSKLSVITLMPGLFLWVPRALCVLSPPAKAGQQQLSLWLPVAGGQGPAWAVPGLSAVPSTLRIFGLHISPTSKTRRALLAGACWMWFSAAVCWDYRNLCLGCVCWLPRPAQPFPPGFKSAPCAAISQQLELLQQITHVVKAALRCYNLCEIASTSRNWAKQN